MVKTSHDTTIYEQGEPEFNQAWDKLIAVGINPIDWMYMETTVTGQHRFKNINTRRYISV